MPEDLGWRLMDRGWRFRDAETCVVVTRHWVSCGAHWHVALREGIRFVWGQCSRGKPHDDLVAIVGEDVAGWPRQRRRKGRLVEQAAKQEAADVREG